MEPETIEALLDKMHCLSFKLYTGNEKDLD